MFRTIVAKFTAKCDRCNRPMEKGQQIRWAKGLRAHHVACTRGDAPSLPATAPQPARKALWRTIVAKYRGHCGRCARTILPGAKVRWGKGAGIWHLKADCKLLLASGSKDAARFVLPDGREINDTNYKQFCVGRLGAGVSRTAYALSTSHVLKVNHEGIHAFKAAGDNASEATLWNKVRTTPDAPLFAAVFALGADGAWMVVERVHGEPAVVPHDLSKRLRATYGLSDLHAGNVRKLANGSYKVIDYAFVRDGASS